METHANYVRVGLFVLLGSIGSIMFVLWLSQTTLRSSTINYDIFFKGSISGLKKGSVVQYRGVPVGTVKDLFISPKNIEDIQVVVAIDKSTVIKSDVIASLESQGLTGISLIQIRGGSQESPPLTPKEGEDRPVISSKSSLVEELSKTLPELIEQTGIMVKELKNLFGDENRTTLTKTIQNIERITEFLTPGPGDKENALKDMGKTMDTVWETLNEFKIMSKELKEILKENRQGIKGFSTIGLESFNKFLSEGQETMMSLRRVTNSLERSPSRFFYNDPNQGVPTK